MKKILALAFLPYWKGGKQTSGLATGIFDLHDAVNSLNGEYEVVLACTDVNKKEIKVDSTRIIGWNKQILLKHACKRLYKIPYFFYKTLKLRFRYKYPFLNTFTKALFLDYAIETEKPVAVHFHGVSSGLYFTLLWNKHTPAILRIHGMNGYNSTVPGYLNYRKKEKDIVKLPFKMMTFISKKNQNDWNQYYGSFSCSSEVVLNGYNSSLFYWKETDANIEKEYDLITIAAIDENKGQIRVLEALSELKKQGVKLKYLVIGSGQEKYVNYIQEYAKNNNLDVTFQPHVNQSKLRDFIVNSRYFILPSAAEGFGKVFVESLACGTPVILPKDLPIVQEGLLSRDNSILMDDETTSSIKVSLQRLEESKLTSSEQISKTVSQLSWKSAAIKYCKIYRSNGI